MLRNFRAVFKGNQMPMTIVMGVVLVGLVAYLAPSRGNAEAPSNTVARVYGRDILKQDTDKVVKNMMQRMGKRMPNMDQMLPFFQSRAMQELINSKLQEELAERHGVVVTDQELADELARQMKQNPAFTNPDGSLKPTSEIQQYLLEVIGIPLPELEKEVRNSLLFHKLATQEATKVPVDAPWLERENRLRNEKITFEAITLTPDANAIADPGDAKLQAFLQAGGARFQMGPRRTMQYVKVDKAALGDILKVDDVTLKNAYESKKASYSEYKPVHILFKASNDTEAAVATAKATALRAELVSGKKDFLRTAESVSEDPSAKNNKGEMGWTKSGMMVKPFEDAALALKEGEISQPVRTQFGMHLIRLDGKRIKPFEEVKEQLRTQLEQERFATKAKEKLEQLRKRAGDKGDLAAPAKNLGLHCQVTAPFLDEPGTGLPGIQNGSMLVQETFNLKIGQVSKVQPLGDAYYVVRPKEEKAPAIPPLSEIRAKVLNAWKLEEARQALLAKARPVLATQEVKPLGGIKTEENKAIASLGEWAKNPAIQQALLDTPVGKTTPALWNNEGHLWAAKILSRTAPEPLTFEKRQSLVSELQKQVSEKMIAAELATLRQEGELRPGLSSLWGRLNGIWINPDSNRKKHKGMEEEE